jgi:hypothetical protein
MNIIPVTSGQIWPLGVVGKIYSSAISPSPEPEPAPSDPYFNYVSLLLHMDGSNGSTTFVDSSVNMLTVTGKEVPPEISTAESKFGGSSCFFNGGTNRWIALPDEPVLDCTGDFTVEAWIYPLSTADMMVASGLYDNTQVFRLNYGGAGNILCYAGGAFIVDAAAGITANSWHHVAMTRSGVNTRVFVNGAQIGVTVTSFTSSLYIRRLGLFFFNGFQNTPQLPYNGYIDELRITKGVARYTANFTPPTEPFPNSAPTPEPTPTPVPTPTPEPTPTPTPEPSGYRYWRFDELTMVGGVIEVGEWALTDESQSYISGTTWTNTDFMYNSPNGTGVFTAMTDGVLNVRSFQLVSPPSSGSLVYDAGVPIDPSGWVYTSWFQPASRYITGVRVSVSSDGINYTPYAVFSGLNVGGSASLAYYPFAPNLVSPAPTP